jgi:hypothetical protein
MTGVEGFVTMRGGITVVLACLSAVAWSSPSDATFELAEAKIVFTRNCGSTERYVYTLHGAGTFSYDEEVEGAVSASRSMKVDSEMFVLAAHDLANSTFFSLPDSVPTLMFTEIDGKGNFSIPNVSSGCSASLNLKAGPFSKAVEFGAASAVPRELAGRLYGLAEELSTAVRPVD